MVSAASKILVRTFLSVFVLIILAGLVLVTALSRGPVSLSFAAPYFDQVLADQYPDVKLAFDDLELLWDGRDKNLVFGMTNVSVTKAKETIAFIPAVTVTFSGEALWTGTLAPAGLEFTGLKLLLTRTEEGGVILGYSYGTAVSDDNLEKTSTSMSLAAIHNLIGGLDRNRPQSELTAYLERLEIYQSGLFIEDEKQKKTWRVSSADLVIWRTDAGVVGRIQGDAHIGDQTINLVANAAYDSSHQTTVINTQIFDFPMSLIAAEIPLLEQLKGFDLPLSGDVNISLDRLFLPVQVGFEMRSGPGRIDLPELYHDPLQIKSIIAVGHSEAPFNALNLNSVQIETIGPQIDMSGSFTQTEEGFGLSIEGAVPMMPTNDLGLYWPYSAAVDGYNWVTNNIRDGKAVGATFRVDLPPGAISSGNIPDGAVELKFSFEGLSTDYFAPLPKATNINGHAILTEKQIHVFDMTGQLQGMSLPEGDALIYDFDKKRQTADIKIKISGENKQIFEFLDLKPLEFVSNYGIDPTAMKGTGKVSTHFVFPLKDDLTFNDVFFDVKGNLEGAFIADVYEGLDLSEGQLSAVVTPDLLTVRGPAKVEGVPAEVKFQSWLKGDKKGIRRYEIQGKIGDKGRKRLKIDTDYLKGPVAASIALELLPGGGANGVVTLNLVEAAIEVEDLHISKPIGVAGLLGAQIQSDGKGEFQISNIRLSSDPLDVVGEALLDKQGFVFFKSSKIAYGENDLTLDVRRKAEDSYVLNLRGRVFDLRPFIVGDRSLNRGRAEPTEDELSLLLNISLDTAIMDSGVTLKNVTGYVDSENGIISQGQIDARFTEEFGINFSIRQSLTGRHLNFVSEHAGLLLQGLDVYDNVREGSLVITADIDDSVAESVAKGRVEMKEIRVVNAPVLGKILTIGSLGGIVDLLKNEGMTFATVEGPFTYENGVITTKDFRAVGSIGITVTGKVDQVNKTVEAFGTVIPSYTLNSMLGNIPILGRLLVGREGEGIFGFSYKVNGTTENPEVSVNPVSALAPGILRRMFFEPWDAKAEGEVPPDAGDGLNRDTKP